MLRPYQQKLSSQIQDALQSDARKILVVLPTGGGKTIVFADLAATYKAEGVHILILAHRIELIDQTSRKLSAIGCEHSLFVADQKQVSQVTVGSVPTFVRALGKYSFDFDLIIVDEAHHVLADNQWGQVIAAFPAAKVIGFTATPCRTDGRGLGEAFDLMIEGPTIKELTALGYLAPLKTFVPRTELDLSGVRLVAGDYNKSQLTWALEKGQIEWQAVKEYKARAMGLPAIAFCVNLMHCNLVHRAFFAADIRSEMIDGTMNGPHRARLLKEFAEGTIKVLISCNVIAEGTDCPEATVALMLRPTKSKGLWLQMVGRVLRPMPSKPYAIVLDLAAGSLEHGLCDDVQAWSLATTAKQSKSKNSVAGNSVCEQCFIAFPAKDHDLCPNCGFKTKVKEAKKIAKGSLDTQEVTSEDIARIRDAKKREVNQARTLPDLLRIEKDRGYKRGWAMNIFHSRRLGRFTS